MITNRPPPDRVEAHEFLRIRHSPATTGNVGLEPQAHEVLPFDLTTHFRRGGFVDSLYAPSERRSEDWRDFYLRYQLPPLPVDRRGEQVDSERFWSFLAYYNGESEESARRALRMDHTTFALAMDVAIQHGFVRRLPFWASESGKARSPLVYVRDTGLWHRLFVAFWQDPAGQGSNARLIGKAWEGFNIEALRGAAGVEATAYVWRRDQVGEIDLILDWSSGARWALEISLAPSKQPSRGFYIGADATGCVRKLVVSPAAPYQMPSGSGIERLDLETALLEIDEARRQHVHRT